MRVHRIAFLAYHSFEGRGKHTFAAKASFGWLDWLQAALRGGKAQKERMIC